MLFNAFVVSFFTNLSLSLSLRIVSTGWTDEETFLRLQASDTGEGCFLCVLKREVCGRETLAVDIEEKKNTETHSDLTLTVLLA